MWHLTESLFENSVTFWLEVLSYWHWHFLIHFSIWNSISHSWTKFSFWVVISLRELIGMIVAISCRIYVAADSLILQSSCNIMSMLQSYFHSDSPPIPHCLHIWDIFSSRREFLWKKKQLLLIKLYFRPGFENPLQNGGK